MWACVRIALVVAALIYLLDAGVEAGKSGDKRNHHRRSKRTHAEREERRRKAQSRAGEDEIQRIELEESNSSIKLVEAQQKLKHHKSKVKQPRINEDHLSKYEDIPSRLYRQFLESQKRKLNAPTDDGVTILPVVFAKLDFYVKREPSKYFYEPPVTTTIDGFSPSELGLVPVHNAKGKYGLHSSAERIFGLLIHISDAGRTNSHFGCGNAIANLKEIPQNHEPWIALIERGHCAFFTKIKLAERNNASAVIIYDNKQEEIPKMNTLGTKIVSVAISKHDGHQVARLADTKTRVLVNIVVNANPDTATTPDVMTTSLRINALPIGRNGPGNGAKSNNAVFMTTTLLTAITAALLQNRTSS